MDVFVRGLYKFSDNRVDENAGTDIGGYGRFDTFVAVRDVDASWALSLWSKKLLDIQARTANGETLTLDVAGVTGSDPCSGYREVSVAPEHTIGITGKYRFGVF